MVHCHNRAFKKLSKRKRGRSGPVLQAMDAVYDVRVRSRRSRSRSRSRSRFSRAFGVAA